MAASVLVLVAVGFIGAGTIAASSAISMKQTALDDAQSIRSALVSGRTPSATQGSPWVVAAKDGPILDLSLSLKNFPPKELQDASQWHDEAAAEIQQATFSDGYFFTPSSEFSNALANQNYTTIETYAPVAAPEAGRLYVPVGTLVHVQVLLTPFVEQQNVAAWRSTVLWMGALAIALVGVTVWFGVGAGLRPVDQLRKRVAELTESKSAPALDVPQTNDEIQRLGDTFNSTLSRLHEEDRRRRDFISDAAHELRSPIASLVTTLEVAVLYPDSSIPQEALATALRQGKRLYALSEDLLLLTRLEGQEQLAWQQVDLVAVLSEIIELQHPIRPVFTSSADRATIAGNKSDLTRLFANLLSNSQRHAVHAIDVDLQAGGESIIVQVSNDGPHVPERDLNRIFERLVRLDEARNVEAGGSGLGLAIARQVAENHGGALFAKNVDARVTFTFTIPLQHSGV